MDRLDDQQRAHALAGDQHNLIEQGQGDLRISREANLELERRLFDAQAGLTLAQGENISLRSAVAMLRAEIGDARASALGLGTVLLAAGVGAVLGAAGAHLLASHAAPSAPAGAPPEPAIDTSTPPAADVGSEPAAAVENEGASAGTEGAPTSDPSRRDR